MTNNELLEVVQSVLGSDILGHEEQYDALIIEIAPKDVLRIVSTLKENEALSFNFLTLIGAVHYPEDLNRELCVVYHLHSWKNAIRLRVKAFLSIENPSIESLCSVFDGANWMERETYDFFWSSVRKPSKFDENTQHGRDGLPPNAQTICAGGWNPRG